MTRSLKCHPIREDVRPEHVKAFLDGQRDFGRFIEPLDQALNRDAWVPRIGTKLIWDSMLHVEKALSEEQKTRLANLFQAKNPVLIRLQRTDRASQAVSRYLAIQSGVWHRFNHRSADRKVAVLPPSEHGDPESAGESDALTYRYEAVLPHYQTLVRAENHLDGFLRDMQLPCLDVSYEALRENPEHQLLNLLGALYGRRTADKALGLWALRAVGATRFVSTSRSASVAWSDQFRRDIGDKAGLESEILGSE
ncbi:MAG: Stf0 family sulfotransferase [Pseudomonadota bacterium]